MRRKLLIGAASLLALILILAVAVFWYIRSGRLDRYVQASIVESLAQFGIRAEIGDTKLSLSGYDVTLKDTKLYSGEAKEPFGSVDTMVVKFSVLSYLQQRINITNVTVDHPQVWVSFDEQGRSNVEALHEAPSSGEAKESAIKFLSAYVKLNRGELHYNDQFRKVTAEITDFDVSFDPKNAEALDEKINHTLTMGFTKASATYEGRPINSIVSRVVADVTDQNANVTELKISSDLGELTGAVRVDSFSPLKYETSKDLHVDAQLEQVARVFKPESKASGAVSFDGKVSGTGDEYKGSGNIVSDRVSAEGYTATNLRVNTDFSGKGDQYKASADFTSGAVTGRDLNISSVKVTDASVSGKGADFELKDALAISSIKSGPINVNNLTGHLTADPESVGLARFSAGVLGGSVTGSATVATGGGASQIEAAFKSIDLNQAADLASTRDVRVSGTASGSLRLSFPGTNYQAATGRINTSFDATVTRPEATESLPARGEVSLIATGHGLNVQRAVVRSTASELTATGSVGWNMAASLAINFRSDDMAEVQRVVEGLGLVPADIKEKYPVVVSGPGSFTGRVNGRLSSPSVSGHLSLASLGTKQDEITDEPGEQLGAIEADLTYSPSLLRVENGSLVRDADSRIDFNVNAPLAGGNNISVQATVQNYDLAALAAVGASGLSDMVQGGTVSGTVDLRGLPGPRTIEGTANLTLSGGEFTLPGAEGETDKKVSVPAFTGNITLANSVVSVDNLKMQVADSEIVGQGSFNLDTYAYTISAQGRNIDLAAIADAARSEGQPPVNLTGRADVDVTGQGMWGNKDDWSALNLNATIQGKNVLLNGRELGDAKIVATTDNGLLRIEATANVLDEMRTLGATINLRERGWPINASVEFTDTDLGPYLALVAPELASISGRATGRITVSGPINPPGEGITADHITARAVITRLELGGNISERQRYTVTNQGDIVVTANPSVVTIEPVTFVGEGTSVTIEGTIAREAARSNLRVDGELNLRFLSSFTPSVFTTGIARVEASIIGSLESPQLRGVVNLRDVGVRVVDFPLSIARGNGAIRFTADQALIENFVAAAPGGGTIRIGGGAALAGLAPDRWRLEVNADQVGIEFPRDAQTIFDASLALQGNRRINVLTGDVFVRRSSYTKDISIEDLLTGGGPLADDFLDVGGGAGGAGGLSGPAITLDLHVTADNTLVIKNNLADAIASAYINIRGSAQEPLISGRVQLTRGTLEFRRGRFELTRGLISLPGRRRAEPILDIESEADISGYHIEVSFTGEISRLQTTVRSDPPLPETDIISLVLTGNVSGDSSTQASVTQTGLGLAQSILSASLSEKLEKGTQRLFGLSRFSIDPLLVGRGSDPTARITIGQRITKDLTVTYSQNLTSGPSGIDRVVLVEYRISNRFSVVGLRNERGELGFDVRLRKRF